MAKFFCEYCGQEFSTVQQLVSNQCPKHPNGRYQGPHKLYEGGEKSQYTCKYCGQQFSTLQQLVSSQCPQHPHGRYQGFHAPSLL